MTDELRQLCMKAESLRTRLISVNDGRYVHEAYSIANILCNAVPNLEHGCEAVNDLENGGKMLGRSIIGLSMNLGHMSSKSRSCFVQVWIEL